MLVGILSLGCVVFVVMSGKVTDFYGRPMEWGRPLYFHPVIMAALCNRGGHYIFAL